MTGPWKAAALVSAGLLAACADTAPPPASGPAAAPRVAASGAGGSAGTRFDGRYTGVADQTMSRNSNCGPQQIRQTLTVEGGQARYVVDRGRNIIATGPVREDGSVQLTAEVGRNDGVTGRIEDGVFTGEFRNMSCGRSLSLRKQG